MNSEHLIFLGVKSRVLAIAKRNGQIIWSTGLPGGMGMGFVTLLSDGEYIFAHTHGLIHCLEMASGRLLWSNELTGCGYGIASLCLSNGATSPDAAAVQQIIAAQQQAAANAGTGA
jgi:hypothetical protein